MTIVPATTGEAIRAAVGSKASSLQRRYAEQDPSAAAELAQLRGASSRMGADPATWDLFETVPPALRGSGDELSAAERAIFCALVLFSNHQQSHRSQSMHQSGRRLGRAVRELSASDQPDPAVVRRFRALGTASSLDGTMRHLRSLIGQLRGAGIPIDYGLLAVDLWSLQLPQRRSGVQRRWGRDFYTSTRSTTEVAADGTPKGES